MLRHFSRDEESGLLRVTIFERYLTAWVAACIVVGVALGQVFPAVAESVGRIEIARVNLPVGVLIWVMQTAQRSTPNLHRNQPGRDLLGPPPI